MSIAKRAKVAIATRLVVVVSSLSTLAAGGGYGAGFLRGEDMGCTEKLPDTSILDKVIWEFYDNFDGKNWPDPNGQMAQQATDRKCYWDKGTRCAGVFGIAGGQTPWVPVSSTGGVTGIIAVPHGKIKGAAIPENFKLFTTLNDVLLPRQHIGGKMWDTSKYCTVFRFDLSFNEMTGDLPDDFLALSGTLGHVSSINLGHNQFTGSIPSSMKDQKALQGLRLNDNQLTGSIPDMSASATFLVQLEVGQNKLTLTSASLEWLPSMKVLSVLDLGNQESGGGEHELPAKLPESLEEFIVAGNSFKRGTVIPESYGKEGSLMVFNCTGCEGLSCPPGQEDFFAHLTFASHCAGGSKFQ